LEYVSSPEPPLLAATGQTQRRGWLSILEAMAVLMACMAVIVVLGLAELFLLAPRTYTAEFELVERPVVGEPGAVTAEELLKRVAVLGLDGHATTRERRGRSVLVISELSSDETIEATIQALLIDSGFDGTEVRTRSTFDAEALIADHPVVTLGIQAVVLIAFGFFFARLRVRPVRSSDRASPAVAVAFGLAAGVAGLFCAVTVSLIQNWFGWSVEEQAWLMELLRDRSVMMAVLPLVVLLVPLAEETFFRGYMFRFLLQRSGPAPAYLLSAGCFSLIHLHLPGLPTYFVVGLLFAWVCRRTSTMLAPVVGHATYNGLALGITLLTAGS
jgi:membrane protease YdiL (CAAX protease family)